MSPDQRAQLIEWFKEIRDEAGSVVEELERGNDVFFDAANEEPKEIPITGYVSSMLDDLHDTIRDILYSVDAMFRGEKK